MGSTPDTVITAVTGSSIAFAFRNVDRISPISTIAASASATTGFPNPPSVTTVNDSSVVVAIGYLDNIQLNPTNISASTGYTLIGSTSGSSTNLGSIMAEYLVKTTPGAEDPGIFRTGSGNPSDSWIANTFVLNRYTSSAYYVGGDVLVLGGLTATNAGISAVQRYPIGHHSAGETVFEIDPTWTERQLQSYFNSAAVTWATSSTSDTRVQDAPGGYVIKVSGELNAAVGYNSGFPLIPVDTGSNDWYYMELWIKNEVGQNAPHYVGSMDFNENFQVIKGNPGTFTYNLLGGQNPGTSWVKYYSYWNGYGTSTTYPNGTANWPRGTKYFSPLALLNYGSPNSSSYISGWKVIKVSHTGNRYFDGYVGIDTAPSTYLHVKESANTGIEGFYLTNWNGTTTIKIGSDSGTGGGKLSLNDNAGTNNIFLSSYGSSYISGSLGIGITTPTTGKLQIDTVSANNNALTIQASTQTSRTYGIGITSTSGLNFYDNTDAVSRLFISSSGNIGIGTITPSSKLDIQGIIVAGNNSSPEGTIILQDQYSAGHLTNFGTNRSSGNPVIGYAVYPSNVTTNAFLSSVTSSQSPERAAFSFDGSFRWYTGAAQAVQTGSLATLTEKMRLDNNGNLGIGMSSPAYRLDVSGSARITGSLAVGNITPSATVGRIDASNDIVAFSTSDTRFKTNIIPIPNALDKISQIGGYEFDWIPNQEYHGFEGHDVGIIAQEIEKVLPEVVTIRDSGYKAVKYEKIVPLLIEAIKEQQKQIDELKYLLQNKI
jgi:hypothetical protein